MYTSILAAGTRVKTAAPGKSGILRGRVAGLDAGHYHARVNGRTVYRVLWNGVGVGSGWMRDDLVVL